MKESTTVVDHTGLFVFDDSTLEIQIDSTDNHFGDRSFTVEVTGENEFGTTAVFSFDLNTHKDCSNVVLTTTDFDQLSGDASVPDVEYTVTDPTALEITYDEAVQEANGY